MNLKAKYDREVFVWNIFHLPGVKTPPKFKEKESIQTTVGAWVQQYSAII